MTEDEAKTIARIVGTADNGCPVCVGELVDQLNVADLGWQFTEQYVEFPRDDDDADERDDDAPAWRSVKIDVEKKGVAL